MKDDGITSLLKINSKKGDANGKMSVIYSLDYAFVFMRQIRDADKMWDQVELCLTHSPRLQMHAAVRDHRFWFGLTLFVHTLYPQQTLLKGSPHHHSSCTVLYS